jgi:5'-nucleotidase
MNILLTNDDGAHAKGINYLWNYFKNRDENVFIVAPDREKSGTSHSITLNDSLRLVEETEDRKVIKGSPADCVITALLGLIPEKIDIVISGINHGPNIGRDILYSGTAAAARQAGFSGIPAIALSINSWRKEFHFETVGDFLDKYFNKLVEKANPDFFYNINFPNKTVSEIKGVKQTFPCPNHYYQDELVFFDSPLQGRYYWVNGSTANYDLQEGTDAKTVKDGFISVSPVKVFPESYDIKLEL